VSVKLGGTNLILLNEPDVVRELIEKRSFFYSARPDTYIREFVGNMNIAFRELAPKEFVKTISDKCTVMTRLGDVRERCII
jgi:hypothetical protein